MWKKLSALSLLILALQACGSLPLGMIGVSPTVAVTRGQPSAVVFKATPPTPIIPTAVPFTPTSVPSTPTSVPAPASTPTPLPPTLTPTSTLTACMQAGGRVEISEFTTTLLPNPLIYHIYLPPCYDEQPEQSYPVLYLVHGMYDSDSQWERLGVPETADRLIKAGEIAPFIVVMPRDRIWVEPVADNFGKAVQQSLVPWIDEHYRTIPDREHRAIGGLSRGGAWAVNIGLSRPDLFSRVGVHSGFVFNTDIPLIYQWLHDAPPDMIPLIYMDIGDRDRPETSQASAWLEDFLTRHDIPHEWHLFSGEHEDAYWKAHVEDYLRWYTLGWGN